MKINSFYFFVALMILPFLGFGQVGTTSTGLTATNSNYQIGFTIGETVISTYEDSGISITNGIVQPIKGIIISTEDLVENKITVYPNPVSSAINIEAEDLDLKTFEIFSIDSKLVHSGLLNEASIDLRFLKTGMYILRLKSSQKTYSTLINKIDS